MEYKKRNLENKIDKLWKEKEMIVISGPRQSGKTTMMKHLKKKYGGKYYSLEDEDILRIFNTNPEFLIDDEVIFFDEIQLSKKAGKVLKYLYDKYAGKVKIVVSGSGAFEIEQNVGAALVGRAFFLKQLTLNFEEFVMWKDGLSWKILNKNKTNLFNYINNKDHEFIFSEKLLELAKEYMVWGGYPAVVLSKNRELKKERLKNIVKTTIERDIARLFSLTDIEKITKVTKYLAANIGQVVQFTKLGVDYKTAEKYIAILQYSDIISLIEPYHKNEKTSIKKSKKIYFFDLGFRNATINNFTYLESRENKGFIIENFIFRELVEEFKLKYWRTRYGAEIDFIIENPLTAIEVKSTVAKRLNSLKNFMEKHNSKGIVFGNELKKGEVLFYPFWLL